MFEFVSTSTDIEMLESNDKYSDTLEALTTTRSLLDICLLLNRFS